jgi:hypothetical protein
VRLVWVDAAGRLGGNVAVVSMEDCETREEDNDGRKVGRLDTTYPLYNPNTIGVATAGCVLEATVGALVRTEGDGGDASMLLRLLQ